MKYETDKLVVEGDDILMESINYFCSKCTRFSLSPIDLFAVYIKQVLKGTGLLIETPSHYFPI
jgi:hypothetical protein